LFRKGQEARRSSAGGTIRPKTNLQCTVTIKSGKGGMQNERRSKAKEGADRDLEVIRTGGPNNGAWCSWGKNRGGISAAWQQKGESLTGGREVK